MLYYVYIIEHISPQVNRQLSTKKPASDSLIFNGLSVII